MSMRLRLMVKGRAGVRGGAVMEMALTRPVITGKVAASAGA